jgi:hypothetical protein
VTAGTLRVTGSIAASSGVTVESTATFDAGASQTVKKLTINNGGAGTVSSGVLKIGDNTGIALTVDGTNGNTAKLDLTSRGAIVDFGLLPGPPILTNYRNQIIAGYNAGTWTGNGITSSAAAADPGGHGVGYAYAGEVGLGGPGSTFMGAGVDGSAVVMRYTILGDASLDGKVDFTDLVALAQNYGSDFTTQPGIEGWWNRGDFNYDGKVDFTDLVKLAQGYGAALPSEPVPGAPIGFQQDLASGFAKVPEPAAATATLALLALGMSRRRSR